MKILLGIILAISVLTAHAKPVKLQQQKTKSNQPKAKPSPEELVKKYEKVARANPDSAEAWCNLGYAYLEDRMVRFLSKKSLAEKAFKEALRLKPDYAEAYHGLAQLAWPGSWCGNSSPPAPQAYETSIRFYQQAVALKPDYTEAYRGLGHAYFLSKRYREAATAFEESSRLDPGDENDYYSLGEVYKELEWNEDALKCFEEVIRLSSDYKLFEQDKIKFYTKSGHFFRSLFYAADIYTKQSRYQEAIENYKRLLEVDSDDWRVHCNLGLAYAGAGDKELAIAEYKAIMAFAENIDVEQLKTMVIKDANYLLSKIRK